MSTKSDKIKRYERLAVKKPKYYVSIGDLYSDDGDFKTATIYYQKAVDNGVLAYTVLGDTWGYRSQYKKAFDAYTEGANKGEAECFARLGFCYETGYVKIDIQKAIECYAKASDLGVAAAARSLGDLYYFNTPIEDSEIENVKNALKYYERAFYLGDIEVAKKIGFIYLNNEELKDVPKAIEWYEKGLSLGEYSLNFDLAYVYLNDGFIPHDYEKGLKYLLDGVHHNDPESLYMYARVRETGMYKVEPDKKMYIKYLKKAARLGQDDALLDLGYYYYKKGKYDDALDCFAQCEFEVVGLYWAIATICEEQKQDYKNALTYYRMAMEMDFPDAIERMAEAYLGDELGLEKDEKTALKLFKRAAKLGNAAAQYNLGMAYACGYYGVTADRKTALHWLKKSVKGENPSACLQVGLYYYYTVKTEAAYKKAFELFTDAYNLGENEAIINIGLCYLQGNGVKEDKKEAVKCFKTAAEKCNSGVAYHNLGICYENGFGVRKDYKKAIEMYGKAVENGEKAGLEAIKNVYLKMGEDKSKL